MNNRYGIFSEEVPRDVKYEGSIWERNQAFVMTGLTVNMTGYIHSC